jgi:FKBP-type peptidyl-prolyl cis-trans isomerase
MCFMHQEKLTIWLESSSLLQGSLTSGTVFDSSLDRGQPIVFTLGRAQVIRGWDQGLEGMW